MGKSILVSALAAAALLLLVGGSMMRTGGLVEAARTMRAFESIERADETGRAGVVKARNEGRLVLVAGTPEILAAIKSGDGRVEVADALVLAIEVRRYERRTSGSGNDRRTTESWEDDGVERRFGHLRLREFAVDPGLLDDFPARQALQLDAAALERLAPKERLAGNEVYYGSGSMRAPSVGDVRYRYNIAPRSDITVLALQRGHELVRESRFASTLGLPLQFELGVALPGRVDAETMLAAQRRRIQSGTGLARAFGAFAIIAGGLLLLMAYTRMTGRTALAHPLQVVPVLAWFFVAFALAAGEKVLAAWIAQPLLLAVACMAWTLALTLLLPVLYRYAALGRAHHPVAPARRKVSHR